jgi:ribosome production factor 1
MEEQDDEFASYFTGTAPKLLITTSKHPSKHVYEFAEELVSIFPNAEFVKRGVMFDIATIVQFCKNRGYTDLMVVNEDRKQPNALTLVHLPEGPTAYFKLSSIKLCRDIVGGTLPSSHKPELVLNHFDTRLGRVVGRMFHALFPQVPEFQGRQVCTLHNQRDFVFFRRHRYEFRNKQKVDLQEIGPRFCLKLKWLQKGTFDPKGGEYEYKFVQNKEERKTFVL